MLMTHLPSGLTRMSRKFAAPAKDNFRRILVEGLFVNPELTIAIGCENNGLAIGGPVLRNVKTLIQSEMPRVDDARPARIEISHIYRWRRPSI